MSRRHRAEKREINPDPKFGDRDLTKFMNYIMLDGKNPSPSGSSTALSKLSRAS